MKQRTQCWQCQDFVILNISLSLSPHKRKNIDDNVKEITTIEDEEEQKSRTYMCIHAKAFELRAAQVSLIRELYFSKADVPPLTIAANRPTLQRAERAFDCFLYFSSLFLSPFSNLHQTLQSKYEGG